MSDQWYVVIDAESGETRSFGTVIADPMPLGLIAVPIAAEEMEAISLGQKEWNPTLRQVVNVSPQ